MVDVPLPVAASRLGGPAYGAATALAFDQFVERFRREAVLAPEVVPPVPHPALLLGHGPVVALGSSAVLGRIGLVLGPLLLAEARLAPEL
jgi:hypothetical protein